MDIRQAVKTGKIRPIKSLGQNYLVDQDVADRVITAAELDVNDIVIEIGPGIGILTEKLCQIAAYVIAVEIDRYLIETLEKLVADWD